MTPERWGRIKEVFESVLDVEPARRETFLAKVCAGDDALRHEVDSLIESHEKSGTFIDSPAYEAVAELLADERPELKPGQQIGAYEIVSFVSRGGMGEVYLAQDHRLNRRVAFKILPDSHTRDADRLRRFEQEAQAVSALNHPNIITIHEILRSREGHIIVTEFVEGESLRQRLTRNTLALAEALNIAIQVADALAAAHAAGIVHRDIKPENIMLRPDGYVKVLDFGLAKLAEQTPSAIAAEAPTKRLRTGSGIVLGTAGYMSPEQARGKTVDARSDIFSLGALIYEMIMQRKPFEGESPGDTIAAILKTDPLPISGFAPDTSSELNRITAKALRKDREERYQVVKDLLLDLKALKQELEFQARLYRSSVPDLTARTAETKSAPSGLTPEASKSFTRLISEALSLEFKSHRTTLTISFILLILVLAVSGFSLYKFLTRTRSVHFQSTSVTRLTNSGKIINARLSRDGKYLAYVQFDGGQQSMWIRQLSAANDTMIIPPMAPGIWGLTFSPDDSELFYVIRQNFDAGTLYRIPILGGTPSKVLERITSAVTFSPEGKRFSFVRASFPTEDESALIIANLDGSNEQTLAIRKQPEMFAPIFFTAPSWSPDGKLIAASVFTAGKTGRVVGFPIDGSKEIELSKEESPFSGQVEWLPDMSGLLVVAGSNTATVNNTQIWFLSYPSGEKRPITNDLSMYRSIGLTADGTRFVTVATAGVVTIWLAADGEAAHAVNLGKVANLAFIGNSVTWTPDNKIVFASGESGEIGLWIADADGTSRRSLTPGGRNVSPFASPDGRYLVFASSRGGQQNIWRMNVDGSNPKQLTGGISESWPVISPDGRSVVYTSRLSSRPTIWKVSIEGGEPVEITHRVSTTPMISPDGKWIAYLYPDSLDPLALPNRIAIMPFDGGEPRGAWSFPASPTVATIAQWSPDGKSILYTVTEKDVTNIMSQPIAGGQPTPVTDFKDLLMSGFAWSRDGRRMVCTRGVIVRDAVLIGEVR